MAAAVTGDPSTPTAAGSWLLAGVRTTATGQRDCEETWNVQDGQWTLVRLNADTSPDVEVDLAIGATAPGLFALSMGLFALGVTAVVGGVLLQYTGLRRRDDRPMPKG
jgi:hypothetical protein